MNKKIVIAVIALVAVIGIMLGVYAATRPEATEGAKTITVTVVHKDGTSKDFTYHTDEEFLASVLLADGLIVESESAGMYNTVDGETADYSVDQSYWAFYIDGEYAMTGMDDAPVTDGAVYKLEYTVYVAE